MNPNYRCVTNIEEIERYVEGYDAVAFDYETAPDDQYRDVPYAALDPAKSHIVGCSFSVEEGTGIYVPIAHLIGENVDKEKFFEFMKAFLTNRHITKIAHNLQFEAMMSYHIGIVIQAPVYDTIVAAQLTLKTHYEWNTLINAKSVSEAAVAVLTGFEKPADQGIAVKNKRTEYGQSYYAKYAKGSVSANANGYPIKVRVTIPDLNIRKGPGTNYDRVQYIPIGVYTIVEEANGQGASKWGKLKSNLGWISMDHVTKL